MFAIRGALAGLEVLFNVSNRALVSGLTTLLHLLARRYGETALAEAIKASELATETTIPNKTKLTALDKLMCVAGGTSKKIAIIKEVRQRTGLGLLEAKNLVENYMPFVAGCHFLSEHDKFMLIGAGLGNIVSDYDRRRSDYLTRLDDNYSCNAQSAT